MSLVVVKTSAVTIYQNRTSTASSVNDQTADSNNHILSQFQATTTEFITTSPILDDLTNHIIRTNIIVGAGSDLIRGNEERGDLTSSQVKENLSKTTTTTSNMRQQQQHLYQEAQHATLTGENAYLLERIDGAGGGGVGVGNSGSVHEQPIYGTWSAKARRPQAPLLAATATTTTTTTASATAHLQPSSSIQTLMTEVDENLYGRFNAKPQKQQQQQQQHVNHHYERLPKRSSTMTPVRRELHDQIPRPPRLTSRQPSVALRRQYSDTPLSMGVYRDESRPKPFHYPFDGPLPEEFKKIQQSERAIGLGLDSDSQVHNIQDILQKLNLGGAAAASKVPPLMMMPTGLHISGSFKNLKSSGIGNFFRGKRNKKQIQMQFPMPIPMQMMPNPYQTTMIMPQPYQQRIAMEQFYPFKARSPGEINLLAMQQQQQQQKFKNPHSKGKKQKKKQKDKKNSSSNLMLQQYPFVTAAPEMIFPSMYSPYMSINVTQAPPLQMSKRVPFKVNLDIFPVMPPSKNHKSPSSYAMDEARLVSTMRAPTVLRNPFMEYLTTPVTPSAAALSFYNPYSQKQPLYNPIRFPPAVQNPAVNMAQSNNLQMVYPEQMQKYLQQQQQQQQQNLFNNFLNTQGHQTPFLPIDCEQPIPSASSSQTSMGNTKTNPIMVHLNVFPKQKPNTPLSTNPFYSNAPQIQRNTIQEENESPQSSIEPRHQGRSLNDTTHYTKIKRSDSSDTIQHIQPLRAEDDLVDFDHPIVAENSDDNNELPQALALQGAKTNLTSESSSSSFFYESRPNATISLTGDNNNNPNNNYNGNTNSNNIEQMVSEAKTASLFRFPVEDLIQFQVNDAM
ncbi:uncharacterized protein ACRADG_002037 [Cochliomyia hominivorax]